MKISRNPFEHMKGRTKPIRTNFKCHSIWETFSNITVQERQYVIKGYKKKIQGEKCEFPKSSHIHFKSLPSQFSPQAASTLERGCLPRVTIIRK